MKTYILIIMCCLAIVGCAPGRKVSSSSTMSDNTIMRDSVYITHIDTVRIVERDTIRLAPINQWHSSVSIAATSSHLENEYCTSEAIVDGMGVLTHTLDTRDSATLPVRLVEVERIVRDTIYRSHDRSHDNMEATEVVVERQVPHVTWWQRTQIVALWVLIGAIIIKYRKVIFKVISGWRI